MESNNGPSSNKRQCSNYSTVIPTSVMDQCGSGSVRSAACDKKTKKLRLASPGSEHETPDSANGRSETASFEYGNSGHPNSRRTMEMNGHSNSGATTSSPLMKNVGVGANLTFTRSINNSYTAGTSSSISTSCSNNGTMTSASAGRNSSYGLDGGGGQGSLILNQGGSSPAPQNQQASFSASATINSHHSLPDVHQHGPGSVRGSDPPASPSPSPSSQAAPNAPQAVAHFLLAQQQHAAGPNFQPSPVSNAASGSASAASAPSNKICSQNLNGTVAVTSVPSNDSELQLFRVLQRANLLSYFDVMIELGGDDVQQLCEAGEEEFLEIMALVGMASKPLHVRRLQKSLQEWMTQPSLFPGPMIGPSFSASPLSQPQSLQAPPVAEAKQETGNTGSGHQLPIRPIPYPATIGGLHSPSGSTPSPPQAAAPGAPYLNPNEIKNLQLKYLTLRHSSLIPAANATSGDVINRSNSNSPVTQPASVSVTSSPTYTQQAAAFPCPPQSPTLFSTSSTLLSGGFVGTRTTLSSSTSTSMFPLSIPVPVATAITTSAYRPQQPNPTRHPFVPVTNPSPYLDNRSFATNEPEHTSQVLAQSAADSRPAETRFDSRSSLSPIPFLQDHEIKKIHDAAVNVVQTLPDYMNEPRVSKRKASADYENVIKLSLDDPRRVAEIRKCSPIYGRYDCKRKVQKPLTIHELSVNEAAAQLCFRIPGLLTRRDELFQLSRQVVRDAGLPYSCIISSSVGLATPAAGKDSTNSKTFSAGSDSYSQTGSDSSCQHLNNNNNGKRVNSSEEYNRSRPELESDTSSQSQHSSCSAGSESIPGAAADYSRFPFETSRSRGGLQPQMNARRDSSEPDDLTIPKPNQSQNDSSSSEPLQISMNMMMSAGITSRSRNLRFKTEPR